MHWYYKIACIVITNWHPVTAVGGGLDNTADSVSTARDTGKGRWFLE